MDNKEREVTMKIKASEVAIITKALEKELQGVTAQAGQAIVLCHLRFQNHNLRLKAGF